MRECEVNTYTSNYKCWHKAHKAEKPTHVTLFSPNPGILALGRVEGDGGFAQNPGICLQGLAGSAGADTSSSWAGAWHASPANGTFGDTSAGGNESNLAWREALLQIRETNSDGYRRPETDSCSKDYALGTAGRSSFSEVRYNRASALLAEKQASMSTEQGKAQACLLQAVERNTVLPYLIGLQILFETRSSKNKHNTWKMQGIRT